MENPTFPDDANRQTIFGKHWLDFETVYEEAGWDVAYEAPAIGEDSASYFTFTPIKKIGEKNIKARVRYFFKKGGDDFGKVYADFARGGEKEMPREYE